MVTPVRKPPDGVRLGAISAQVFERIAKYTGFPWPVMQARCEKSKLDPRQLDEAGLRALLPLLVASVARFTSPQKGEALRAELESLLAGIAKQERRADG